MKKYAVKMVWTAKIGAIVFAENEADAINTASSSVNWSQSLENIQKTMIPVDVTEVPEGVEDEEEFDFLEFPRED